MAFAVLGPVFLLHLLFDLHSILIMIVLQCFWYSSQWWIFLIFFFFFWKRLFWCRWYMFCLFTTRRRNTFESRWGPFRFHILKVHEDTTFDVVLVIYVHIYAWLKKFNEFKFCTSVNFIFFVLIPIYCWFHMVWWYIEFSWCCQ